MSKYEMLDYDALLGRIGITPGTTWFCGDNPPEEWQYEQAGFTYDDVRASYTGRNQGHGTLCLTEDINVNGLLLNHRDRNGTIWLCTGIEGWWTLPPADIPEVPKPYWDGNLLTTGRYLARTITISGCFIPPDKSLVWYNRDALIRVSSIVRGIGMLAMCGNESPVIGIDSPFFDPPKIAVIQMNDVPLIETVKPNGFTQFSLSFRAVQPTKLSAYEKGEPVPVEESGITRQRKYKSFAQTAAEDPTGLTTQYSDLIEIEGSPQERQYKNVRLVNFDSLIDDEEFTEFTFPPQGSMTDEEYEALIDSMISEYYAQTDAAETKVLHNAGNYFAFPVFVFDAMTNVSEGHVITLQNITTGEKMEIQKSVDEGNQLVVDTSLRRVALVDPDTSASSWVWNQRSALTLASEWISLAPGDNTIIMSKPAGTPTVEVPTAPTVYWRDTWIG